jgi:hypothetical protein
LLGLLFALSKFLIFFDIYYNCVTRIFYDWFNCNQSPIACFEPFYSLRDKHHKKNCCFHLFHNSGENTFYVTFLQSFGHNPFVLIIPVAKLIKYSLSCYELAFYLCIMEKNFDQVPIHFKELRSVFFDEIRYWVYKWIENLSTMQ